MSRINIQICLPTRLQFGFIHGVRFHVLSDEDVIHSLDHPVHCNEPHLMFFGMQKCCPMLRVNGVIDLSGEKGLKKRKALRVRTLRNDDIVEGIVGKMIDVGYGREVTCRRSRDYQAHWPESDPPPPRFSLRICVVGIVGPKAISAGFESPREYEFVAVAGFEYQIKASA